MKLLTSLLILSETVFGLRASCDENALANVTNGQWECEPTENERGQSCQIKCDDGHYLPRPGPAKRARCKIDDDDNSRKTWIYPHMEAGEPMPEFKCLGLLLERIKRASKTVTNFLKLNGDKNTWTV